MAFEVYLTDGINLAELDTENIDVSTTFSITDLQDISNRKDKIQAITFKGTKTNNHVFGSWFELGRSSDFSIGNNLYFNYNPLRSVTCIVYEDSELIFKGSLRLSEISIDKNGQAVYSTVLTGPVIDLKTIIQDKYLHDLDFSDLRHRYNMTQIQNTWSTSTERYDSTTSGYTSTDFAYGEGYIYPAIDYGYRLSGITDHTTYLHSLNLKPAVYVTEYMDRIFGQPELTGYTYEIKGDTGFTEMFNHLVVPDSQEGLFNIVSGITSTYSLTGTGFTHTSTNFSYQKLIPLQQVVHPTSGIDSLLVPYSTYNDVLISQRKFKTVFNLNMNLRSRNYRYDGTAENVVCRLRLVTRTPQANNNLSGWATVAEKEFLLESQYGTYNQDVSFDFEATIEQNMQVAVMVNVPNLVITTIFPSAGYVRYISYTANTCQLSAPKNQNTILTNELTQVNYNEIITPAAPVNIKQIDFLKSLMNQFNLYCYSSNINSKHLIFENHDNFYAYCQPQYLNTVALDWSGKVDYSQGFKQVSNLNLPKSYLFTYKDDEDYLNKYYKVRFNKPYGSFTFDDSYGLVAQQKQELIFSPLIIAAGSDRVYPLLFKVEGADGTEIKKSKTNIRIGYYNGLQECSPYSIYNYDMDTVYAGSSYPQISNYYLSGSTPTHNLHFGRPNEAYFGQVSEYIEAPTSYENYYINQVSDLTNPDVKYFECSVLLTPLDIANLDLRIPIYIDTGSFGSAYFKIVKLEYQGKDQPSKISLQKIVY